MHFRDLLPGDLIVIPYGQDLVLLTISIEPVRTGGNTICYLRVKTQETVKYTYRREEIIDPDADIYRNDMKLP